MIEKLNIDCFFWFYNFCLFVYDDEVISLVKCCNVVWFFVYWESILGLFFWNGFNFLWLRGIGRVVCY